MARDGKQPRGNRLAAVAVAADTLHSLEEDLAGDVFSGLAFADAGESAPHDDGIVALEQRSPCRSFAPAKTRKVGRAFAGQGAGRGG